MPRCEFVTDFWNLQSSNTDLCKFKASCVHTHHDIVHNSDLCRPHADRCILLIVLRHHGISIWHWRQWAGLADEHIISKDTRARLCQSIIIKLGVVSAPHRKASLVLRSFKLFNFLAFPSLFCSVAAIGHRSHEAAVNGRLAQHQTIFLIVSCVAHDEHHRVGPCWHFPEAQVIHRSGTDKRLHGIAHHASKRVKSRIEIGAKDTNGLLTHR
mmetsp:Transcript_39706/g.69769  ORF Transcript_39706/g.69769 Transcript_39706/m.69769 type:complete len:212 (-) Transcript_39706:692-1327(-)